MRRYHNQNRKRKAPTHRWPLGVAFQQKEISRVLVERGMDPKILNSGVGGALDNVLDFGKDLLDGLRDGISDLTASVKDQIKEWGTKAEDFLEDTWDSVRPSEKFKKPPMPPAAGPPQPVPPKAQILVDVIEGIPWPHGYMKSVLYRPEVPVGPFHQGVAANNYPGLIEAGYFEPRKKADIEHDVALWVVINSDALSEHAQLLIERYLKMVEDAQRKWQEEMADKQLISVIGTFAASFIPYVGTLVSTILQKGTQFELAKSIKGLESEMSQLRSLLDITTEQMDTFKIWISEKAVAPAKPEGFRVAVEGEDVGTAKTVEEANQVAMGASEPGDRVEVFDAETGNSLGFFIRSAAELHGVPPEAEGNVRQSSPEDLEDMMDRANERAEAQVDKPGPPWWLAIPAAIAFM